MGLPLVIPTVDARTSPARMERGKNALLGNTVQAGNPGVALLKGCVSQIYSLTVLIGFVYQLKVEPPEEKATVEEIPP